METERTAKVEMGEGGDRATHAAGRTRTTGHPVERAQDRTGPDEPLRHHHRADQGDRRQLPRALAHFRSGNPFESFTLLVAMRTMSMSAQIPQPPRVKSLAIPSPVLPR